MSGTNGNGNGSGNGKQPTPTTFFQFMDLPPELVRAIFSFSTPLNEAALSATCRDLVSLSGISWDKIWADPDLAWAFLKRVEQDANPRLVPCRDCLTLHLPQACLRSYAEPGADETYKCRTAGALAPFTGDVFLSAKERRTLYFLRLVPALYGLAKYRRLGLDTSFMTEADQEHEYDHAITIRTKGVARPARPLTVSVRNKVNLNKYGVWFRQTHVVPLKDWIGASGATFDATTPRHEWMYKWLTCKCGDMGPRFTIVLQDFPADDGTTLNGPVFLIRLEDWDAWNDPYARAIDLTGQRMLWTSHFLQAKGPLKPVEGPPICCPYCSTDYETTIKFLEDGPELVMSSWMHLGRGDSPDWIQDALSNLIYSFDSDQGRMNVRIGGLRAMSGMTA